MNKTGPIIVIEDDQDDREMLVEIFSKLGHSNKVIYFHDGADALVFLNQTTVHPFLIISDINMPKINGLELRSKILNTLQFKNKCIPYLFLTTAANQKSIIDAYAMSVQGFFIKPDTSQALENTINNILNYWKECIAPNPFD